MNNNGSADNASSPSPDSASVASSALGMPTSRPLARPAKIILILSACAMIALCYAFSLVAMSALLAMLVVELILLGVLLRVGASRVMTPFIKSHGSLLALFVRSLWLREADHCRVLLSRSEAPRLFALLNSLAGKLGIAMPREVFVEMNVGAWIELRGWRRGSKATRLGLGYDLLAGLTEDELEAVLAHEMVHARLVRRGVKTWLRSGLVRIANLCNHLSARQEAFRIAKKSFPTGEICLAGANACTRTAARLVAAYSRQDEFEADLGAAQLCGSAPLRAALLKLRRLLLRSSRLSWSERVAKLQQGEGYAAWFLSELSAENAATGELNDDAITDPYSTHPSIHDRLAALPPAHGPAPVSPPAIEVLISPDGLADLLIREIERLGTINEARDDRKLRKVVRQIRSGASLRPLHVLSFLVFVGALFAFCFAFAEDISFPLLIISIAGIGSGTWIYQKGRYKDHLSLPIPSFEGIKAATDRLRDHPDISAEEKRLEEHLKKEADKISLTTMKHLRKLECFYHERAFAALSRCDYLEAHVAGRLGLVVNKKSVPCDLAYIVAAGSLRQDQLVLKNLQFLKKTTGIRTPAILWGVAWSLFLIQDWISAEALLTDLLQLHPDNVTLHLLLAECAAHRNKPQTALAHARTAADLAPANIAGAKLLLELLIAQGYVREATERVTRLPADIHHAPSLRLCRVRLYLLTHDFEAAHTLEKPLLQEAPADAALRLQLASSHESMRRHDRAWELYDEVTRLGHYPEALVGLGRFYARRGQREDARRLLLSALNTKTPAAPKAVPALSFFTTVLSELRGLRGSAVPCKAWILTFAGPGVREPLANESFVIFGRDEKEAIDDMKILADAIIPENTIKPEHIHLRLAPSDRQPVGAVIPGVQYVWK